MKKTPSQRLGVFYGAGDEARTRYLHLGKVALYRMSYTRKLVPTVGIEFLRFQYQQPSWCLRSESNQRHVDFQSTALPTELQRHVLDQSRSSGLNLATPNGLEPSTSSVTGWRANRLHHRAIILPLNFSDEMYYTRHSPLCQHFFSKFPIIFSARPYSRKSPDASGASGDLRVIRVSPSRHRGSCPSRWDAPPHSIECRRRHPHTNR